MKQTVEFDRCAIAKVRGADPERFVIVWANLATIHKTRRTTNDLTESELRGELEKMGHPKTEIDELIQKAREHPGI